MELHIATGGTRSKGRKIERRVKAFWLPTVGLLLGLVVSSGRLAIAQEGCAVTVHPGDSIQSAIDAAPQGAVICLGEGTWQENIRITKSLTIRGQGPDKTVIKAAKEGPIVVICGQAALEGLTVTGAKGSRAHGIWLCYSAQATIQNCVISDSDYGIVLSDKTQAIIQSCSISKNKRYGIYLDKGAWARVQDCNISNNWRYAVYADESARATIQDCTMSNSDGGIMLCGRAQASIQGCTISDIDYNGIELKDSAQLELTKSFVHECEDGIVINGQAGARIISSTISSGQENGVEVLDSGWVEITSSSICENRDNGVALWGEARANIFNTLICGNWGHGVEIGSSALATISGNTIEGNGGCGIFSWSSKEVKGQENVMMDNGVDLCGNLPETLRIPLVEATEKEIVYPDNRYRGLQEAVDALLPGGKLRLRAGVYEAGVTISKSITIEPAERAEVTLQAKSRIVSNIAPVVSVIGDAQLKLTGLNLTGGAYGLILGANTQAAVRDCAFTGNDYGIMIRGLARAEIVRCSVSKNRWFGIGLWDSTQAKVIDSTVSVNWYGIVVIRLAQAEIISCDISENWHGIVLSGSPRAMLEGNRLVKNQQYAVVLFQQPCFKTGAVFSGCISGRQNVIPGPGELDGNGRGTVCPEELDFLMTEQGGKFEKTP